MQVPVDEDISQLSLEVWQNAAQLALDTEIAPTVEPKATLEAPRGGGIPPFTQPAGTTQEPLAPGP